MNERIDTAGQVPGSKEELIASSHPVIQMLRELPQVIFPGDEGRLPDQVCSLKQLFGREGMDAFHVERQRLYFLALSVATLLEGLSQRGICPGLLDLEDLVVNPEKEDSPVYLLRPQRFQLLSFEQDYEWYPEDERLLGEGPFFDENRQLQADLRLIYKILIGSCRGNVKVPPAKADVDYAHLFYQQMPEDLRGIFEYHKPCSRLQMIERIKRHMMMERAEAAKKSGPESEKDRKESQASLAGQPLFCTFVLLRTQLRHPFGLEKIFYQQLESLENEVEMTGEKLYSSFVYGSQVVEAREFREYPKGFRFELSPDIRDYSFGEALVIARDMIADRMDKCQDEQSGHRLYLLLDGKIKNDQIFQKMVDELELLRERGLAVFLLESGECYCEAKEQLCRLLD